MKFGHVSIESFHSKFQIYEIINTFKMSRCNKHCVMIHCGDVEQAFDSQWKIFKWSEKISDIFICLFWEILIFLYSGDEKPESYAEIVVEYDKALKDYGAEVIHESEATTAVIEIKVESDNNDN